jgi:hypothetical protein
MKCPVSSFVLPFVFESHLGSKAINPGGLGAKTPEGLLSFLLLLSFLAETDVFAKKFLARIA